MTGVLLHTFERIEREISKSLEVKIIALCLTCLPNLYLTIFLFSLLTTHRQKHTANMEGCVFCRTSLHTCPKIKLIWKKIKLNQTPKCFITYLCFQPLRECITKIWIIKDIWVLLRRREKKQSLMPYFIWKKCCYLWKVSDRGLWCVWGVKWEKYMRSVYIWTQVTPPYRRPH